MPNTFGSPSSNNLQFPLYDPRLVRQHRQRFVRDLVPELGYANALYVPSGRWPARGWLLMRRKDLDALPDLYATNFVLNIEDMKRVDSTKTLTSKLTFKNLAIVQSRCVSAGQANNPDALFLVEVTDGRGILCNRWFDFPTTSQYNIRAPAYPEEYYEYTLDGGIAWTWDLMVRDLWEQMSAFLGAYPGLPVVPDTDPEGWSFPGVSAWHALCKMLDQIGCYVACDLTKNSPCTIVEAGATDDAFDALQERYAGFCEDTFEWKDVGGGRVPGTVIVYFHRRNEFYGTEETIRRDTLQWQTSSVYSVSVPAPADFTGATGTAGIWSDYTVRYDVDNNILAADAAEAALQAIDEAEQFFDRIYAGTLGQLWHLYAGALPFVTGSQVNGVAWRQDFRENQERQGWLTEVTRTDNLPPWPEVLK